jgi:hypothetical protein
MHAPVSSILCCSGAVVAFTEKVWRCGVRDVKGARDLDLYDRYCSLQDYSGSTYLDIFKIRVT